MMKEKGKQNNSYWDYIFCFVAAIFLTISFFVVTQCNTDDSGTYMWVYWGYELGSVKYTLKQLIDPWNLITRALYTFGIGTTGAEMVAYCFAIWYFWCVFITFLLLRKDIQKNYWLLFLGVFMLLPSSNTNKYHLVPIFVSLMLLFGVGEYVNRKRKLPIIGAGILLIYSFVVISDRVLLLMFVVVPAVLYGIIWCLQNVDRQKILYFIAVIVSFMVVGIKIVDHISKLILGHGLSFMEAWGGYGGESYLTWSDVYNFFDKGIPSLCSTLLIQYNIPIEGGLIQFDSFFWIIRIVIVGLAIIALMCRWIDIFKKGIVNVPLLDALSAISVTSLLGVNVINGMIAYYEIESAPMNRYASLAWFLLVVLLIRWIGERYVVVEVVSCRNKKIASGFAMGIILCLLIVGYSKPIYLGREAIVQEPCQMELNYLKSQGDKYKYGIASFWRSCPIIAMSNGQYVSHPGWILQDEEDSERYYFETKYDGIYDDGSNYFNYIISYENNTMTFDKETIEKMRGDYVNKKGIYYGKESSIFYLYDYDIRWEPRLIMEAVGTDYELVEPIEYHFDFPVGTNRIEMTVANSENFELEVVNNPDIQNVTIQRIDDSKIQVDIVCLQNTSVDFKVARQEEELTTIHKIVLKRVRAAVTVDTEEVEETAEVYLESGDYVFTFSGENLDKLQVNWSGEGINVSQLTDGKIRRRYQVEIGSPQTIKYQITGNEMQVNTVSYENAILFEEE